MSCEHGVMNYQALQRELGTKGLRFLAYTISVTYYAIGKVTKQSQAEAEHRNNSTARRRG